MNAYHCSSSWLKLIPLLAILLFSACIQNNLDKLSAPYQDQSTQENPVSQSLPQIQISKGISDALTSQPLMTNQWLPPKKLVSWPTTDKNLSYVNHFIFTIDSQRQGFASGSINTNTTNLRAPIFLRHTDLNTWQQQQPFAATLPTSHALLLRQHDATGQTYLLWQQEDSQIFINTYDNDQGWKIPESIGIGHSPQLALDPQGNAVVVWLEDWSNGLEYIHAAKYHWHNGLDTVHSIERGQLYSQNYTTIDALANPIINTNGHIIIAWSEIDNQQTIYTANLNTESGWSITSQPLNLGIMYLPLQQFNIWLTANSNQLNLIYIREQFGKFNKRLFYTQTNLASQQWSPPIMIDANINKKNFVIPDSKQIVANEKGEALIVWQEDQGNVVASYARHFSTQLGWSAILSLDISATIDGNNHQITRKHFSVSMDQAGNTSLAWVQEKGKQQQIIYVELTQTWSPPEILSFFDSSHSLWSAPVLVKQNNQTIIAWMQKKQTTTHTQLELVISHRDTLVKPNSQLKISHWPDVEPLESELNVPVF